MTYRRDLLNIRVVVRPTPTSDSSMDPAPQRLGGTASLGYSPRPATDPRASTARPPSPGDPASTSGVILVKTGLKQVAVRLTEVTFVVAARNYVRIHLDGGSVLKARVPITRLAHHLGDRFLRIHRGRLVNVDRVRTVNPVVGGRLALTLTDGSKIIVARDRRRVVLAELGRSAAAPLLR